MSRARVILTAAAVGAVIGLFSPLRFLLVVLTITALVAVVLGVRSEGRKPSHVLLAPAPYAIFGGVTVVFALIGMLGLVLGLVAALALVIGFVAIGGDLG